MMRINRLISNNAKRFFSTAAFTQNAKFEGYNYQEFDKLSESYMKVVGGDVDT
jgi:hypothetical protein